MLKHTRRVPRLGRCPATSVYGHETEPEDFIPARCERLRIHAGYHRTTRHDVMRWGGRRHELRNWMGRQIWLLQTMRARRNAGVTRAMTK